MFACFSTIASLLLCIVRRLTVCRLVVGLNVNVGLCFMQLLCCCFSVQFIIIIIAIDCSLVSLPSSSFSQRSISSTFTRMDSIRAANETLNSVDVHKAPVKGTERKSYKTHIDGVCLCVRYAYVAVHDDVCLLLLN